jgi:signal peptide peptidase SppA
MAKANGVNNSTQPSMVGVLPVVGVLSPRLNMIEAMCGGQSTTMLHDTFNSMVEDNSVGKIILQIDSPGGNVLGIQEFGNSIFNARDKKEIIAVCDGQACSAAFALATQASKFYMTPSGLTGSVGVYGVHVDESEKDAKEGVKYQVISAGKHKVEGFNGPLPDEGVLAYQGIINGYYDTFLRDVARGRNTTVSNVEKTYGQGRVVNAQMALDIGMIDGIKSFNQVVDSVLEQRKANRRTVAEKRNSLATKFPGVFQ